MLGQETSRYAMSYFFQPTAYTMKADPESNRIKVGQVRRAEVFSYGDKK
jgi:hypothetical protein